MTMNVLINAQALRDLIGSRAATSLPYGSTS